MRKISIKEIRESFLISKTELARMANISLMTVTRIEQGHPCKKKTKRKIILALKHKISYGNEVGILYADNREQRSGADRRRSGVDRRQYSYDKHIPERRGDQNRRNRLDRRLKPKQSE